MRVGIFGGAFNPPHIGHMVCAQEAYRQLELDRVLLMPVGEAPHKSIQHDPGRKERFQLCSLATVGVEWIEVSRDEIDRPGPAYTVDTLEALHARAAGDERHLILGADQAMQLASWRQPRRVAELACFAVTERGEASLAQVRAIVDELGGELRTFRMPRVDVASREVRRRVGAGEPYRYLVPEGVAERIERQGLYR